MLKPCMMIEFISELFNNISEKTLIKHAFQSQDVLKNKIVVLYYSSITVDKEK